MSSEHQNHEASDTGLPRRLSRRRFLEIAGAAAAGLFISSCTPAVAPAEVAPTDGAAPAEFAPAETPPQAAPTVTETAVSESTAVASATATPAPTGLSSQVAIGTARDYERAGIRAVMEEMLDDLGGLGDVVRPGDRVAIKTNLTGGLGNEGPPGLSPMESFVTHPEVVRVLSELVLDAGASEILIVEAVYQWGSYVQWGYEDIAEGINATLIDLNATDPYDDYIDATVPGGGEIYESFIFNPILQEVDVFMSAAKMKCHWVAGVTHSLKNLVGLVPARFYQLSREHSHRSAFHGPSDETAGQRIPRIIVELNKTRPIDFALVDGIKTSEGGEGPWIRGFGSITPGVLFAGKDPVATDAIATAAQGFDPTSPGMREPFVRGENHLNLAAAAGLGTNRLDEIATFGANIEDIRTNFRPCLG
ncbi:MAG: DUF362 domain-containing protein [Anaerolineae bacterium]